MKIQIDTEILKKYDLTLGQFLILLSCYYDLDYKTIQEELHTKGLIEKNLFSDFPPIISNNTKELITKIIIESDDKLLNCGIDDFEELALKLQSYYPDGIKPGKTYSWRSTVDNVVRSLRILVARYNFRFTQEEAIQAVKEYVSSFQPPYTYMHTLQNFIFYSKKKEGQCEIESLFMTIIENNRSN